MKTVCFLCAHGSPDPRAAHQLAQLTAQVQALVADPVYSGTLENLAQQVQQALTVTAAERLVLVSLFVTEGNHLVQDIPEALSNLAIPWVQTPALSSLPGLVPLLVHHIPPGHQVTLFAHGSRRPGAQTPVVALAQQIENQIQQPAHCSFYQAGEGLALRGECGIVLPLFVFDGGLVDWAQGQLPPGWSQAPPLGCYIAPLLADTIKNTLASHD